MPKSRYPVQRDPKHRHLCEFPTEIITYGCAVRVTNETNVTDLEKLINAGISHYSVRIFSTWYRDEVRTFRFHFIFQNIYFMFTRHSHRWFPLWSKFGWLLAVGEAVGWWIRGAFDTDHVVLEFGNIPWDFNILRPKKLNSPRATIMRTKY